ncbi:MAG: hypoxanthine phosphoribosyltransferase [Firmicutes bacterium]|nr:hypoxanthine phosphoribosyltransferase [Bacillota bacterium]
MNGDVAEILLEETQIQAKVRALASQLSSDYEGMDLVMVCILKGAVLFMADLMRYISIPVTVDFMAISSYGAGTKTSGVVRILKDLDEPVQGKHVLIVEDIVDTGLTLKYLQNNLSSRQPASLRSCVLLDKPTRREVDIQPDYVGFEMPDRFMIGYGLDYSERYRNLPFIGVLKPQVYQG